MVYFRHIALDREHLERSEAKLQEEVESRAAQPLAAKVKLEEKLSQVEVRPLHRAAAVVYGLGFMCRVR